MIKKRYFIPDYILKFQCSMCGECCSRDWSIAVDKDIYHSYTESGMVDEQFIRVINDNSEERDNGCFIKLKKFGEHKVKINGSDVDLQVCKCPFLEQNKCIIQQNYGERAIPETCKKYPRVITTTERGTEMALIFSCRTAAELLQEKHQIEFFDLTEGYEFIDLTLFDGDIPEDLNKRNIGKGNYFEIEEILIDVMQNRLLSIEERIISIGLIIRDVINGKHLQKDIYLDESQKQRIENIKPNPILFFEMIEDALTCRLKFDLLNDERIADIISSFINFGIFDKEIPVNFEVLNYMEGYKKFIEPFIQNNSHILENYFVNYIFSKKFYKHKYIEAYLLLVMHYSILKFFLVLKCMQEDSELNAKIIIDSIQLVELLIGHNYIFQNIFLEMATSKHYNKIDQILSVIK